MAFLSNSDATPWYFVNVQNASRSVRSRSRTFGSQPNPPVNFVNMKRRLPVRIATRDQWETWLEIASVPAAPPEAFELARVQFGDDCVVKSVERQNVPAAGMVPGT